MAIHIFKNTLDWTKNQIISENPTLCSVKDLCEYTVQKLKSLQIAEEIKAGAGEPASLGKAFWGTYLMTEISEEFYDIIKDSGFSN